jgi:hypothetical protein
MKPRIGTTLSSTTDATTVIVIRWGDSDVEVTCGGGPMVDARGPEANTTTVADPTQQASTQMGKRYADGGLGVELLCTKAGQGTLAVNGRALALTSAKPLPSSD